MFILLLFIDRCQNSRLAGRLIPLTPKVAHHVQGCVLHDGDESGVAACQGLQNAEPVAKVLVFELLLEQVLAQKFVCLYLILKFLLHLTRLLKSPISLLQLFTNIRPVLSHL